MTEADLPPRLESATEFVGGLIGEIAVNILLVAVVVIPLVYFLEFETAVIALLVLLWLQGERNA